MPVIFGQDLLSGCSLLWERYCIDWCIYPYIPACVVLAASHQHSWKSFQASQGSTRCKTMDFSSPASLAKHWVRGNLEIGEMWMIQISSLNLMKMICYFPNGNRKSTNWSGIPYKQIHEMLLDASRSQTREIVISPYFTMVPKLSCTGLPLVAMALTKSWHFKHKMMWETQVNPGETQVHFPIEQCSKPLLDDDYRALY